MTAFQNFGPARVPRGGGGGVTLVYALCATLLFFFATPTFAQDDADERETLDEIVVTATKRETGLMETPIAVTAVTQEDLTRDGVQDIRDLETLVPNAQIGHSPSDSGVQVTVRGITSNNFTEIGDPSIGVHVDGMYSPRPQGGLALLHDVERVEILRGPQGTLFGRNSTSGTINVISARPEFEDFSGSFDLEYGRWEHQLARGVLNVPLSDTWAVRGSFMVNKADSWITQVNDDFDLQLVTTAYQVTNPEFAGAQDQRENDEFDPERPVSTDNPRRIATIDNPDFDDTEPVSDENPMKINIPDEFTRYIQARPNTGAGAGLPPATDTDPDAIPGSEREVVLVPADGIPNVDQRRAQPGLDASDAYGNANRWAFRVSSLWQPSDHFEWLLSFDRYKDNGAGGVSLRDCEKAAGTVLACDDPQWFARINVPGRIDMTIDTWRSALTWEFETMTAEYRVAVSDQERSQSFDGDGGAHADPDHPRWGLNTWAGLLIRNRALVEELERTGVIAANTLPWEDLQLTTRWSNYESVVNEFQLKSNTDGALQWIVGFFDMREKNAIRFDVALPFCCGVIRPLAQSFIQPDRRVESRAVFAQFDYALSDRTNLTLGYRHTEDKKSDNGGANYITTGYWDNAGAYNDPATEDFWYESYQLIGLENGYSGYYQSDTLDPTDGSLGEHFPDRFHEGHPDHQSHWSPTDNSYAARWSQGTWRVGFDTLLTDDLFVYGYVATGFKAGGFGDKVDTNGPFIDGGVDAFQYEPEEVTTFEMGFKLSLQGGDLNLLGNAFFNDYTNLQRTSWVIVGQGRACTAGNPRTLAEGVEAGGDDFCMNDMGEILTNNEGGPLEVSTPDIGTLLTTNIAEAEIKGVELEFDWQNPWEGGRIFGWVAYLDAEITNLPGANDGWFCFERAWLELTECPPINEEQTRPGAERRTTDFTGNTLPWSPEWSLTINVEHSWWLKNGWRISPYFSFSWTDEIFFSDNNFDEGPFHTGREALSTYNAALRFIHEDSGWAGEIYAYNLSDELIRTWADSGPGYMRANFAAPRNYGVKIRREF